MNVLLMRLDLFLCWVCLILNVHSYPIEETFKSLNLAEKQKYQEGLLKKTENFKEHGNFEAKEDVTCTENGTSQNLLSVLWRVISGLFSSLLENTDKDDNNDKVSHKDKLDKNNEEHKNDKVDQNGEVDNNDNVNVNQKEKKASVDGLLLGAGIIFGIFGYLIVLAAYETLLFSLFYGFENFHAYFNGEYVINGNKFKEIVCHILQVAPAIPVLIIFAIIVLIMRALKDTEEREDGDQKTLQTRSDVLLKEFDKFGNLKKHKFHTVTRWEVDNFVFDIDSDLLNDFDYLDSCKSFSKTIIKGHQSNDQDSNSSISQMNLISDGAYCCVLCLEPFENNENLILFPCNHYFHEFCLKGFRTATTKRKSTRNESINFRCLLCRLDLARHYCFYKNYGLEPAKVHFQNKITTPRN